MSNLQNNQNNFYHTIIKPTGAQCNLDCTYCFYLHKEDLLTQPKNPRMSLEVLEEHIKQYIESQTGPEVIFTWQGGEPTLIGLDFYKKAVELQQKYKRPYQNIENDLQTNGVLLDDEWCKFLKQHNFLVGISIDGPGAHIAEEALYFSALKDIDGADLSGNKTYIINFEKGKLPPVKAFWSLILYDKNFWLVDNPISRYSINDRTDGLVYENDGSLKIIISNTKPENISGNWLPAPKDNFRLIFRTYLPETAILDKSYKLPPVTLAK